jgi:putative type II/III system pilus formation protein
MGLGREVLSNSMVGLVKQGCRRGRIQYALAVFAVLAAVAAHGTLAMADTFTVVLDQAKVLKVPDHTTTVVVGNPLIADIAIQSGGVMVVTGKGYGVTNLLALDTRGNTLMEQSIEVQGPNEHIVIVHRGIERESYSCTPKCERRITLGDSPAFFDATLLQTGRRDGLAQGAGNTPSSGR